MEPITFGTKRLAPKGRDREIRGTVSVTLGVVPNFVGTFTRHASAQRPASFKLIPTARCSADAEHCPSGHIPGVGKFYTHSNNSLNS